MAYDSNNIGRQFIVFCDNGNTMDNVFLNQSGLPVNIMFNTPIANVKICYDTGMVDHSKGHIFEGHILEDRKGNQYIVLYDKHCGLYQAHCIGGDDYTFDSRELGLDSRKLVIIGHIFDKEHMEKYGHMQIR